MDRKRQLKQLINFILIWVVNLFMPEGDELNRYRTKIIRQIVKKNKFFPDDEPELLETLKETFGISKIQAIYLWGENTTVSKETFEASIKILAEIVPYHIFKSFFKKDTNV